MLTKEQLETKLSEVKAAFVRNDASPPIALAEVVCAVVLDIRRIADALEAMSKRSF